MASGPIPSWQIYGGKVKTVTDFLFLTSKIAMDSPEIKDASSLEGQLSQI